MPAIGCTRPERDIAPLRSAIETEMPALDVHGRGAVVNVETRVGIAGKRSDPPVAERQVAADYEPANRAIELSGIAIAVPPTPGAKPMPPKANLSVSGETSSGPSSP